MSAESAHAGCVSVFFAETGAKAQPLQKSKTKVQHSSKRQTRPCRNPKPRSSTTANTKRAPAEAPSAFGEEAALFPPLYSGGNNQLPPKTHFLRVCFWGLASVLHLDVLFTDLSALARSASRLSASRLSASRLSASRLSASRLSASRFSDSCLLRVAGLRVAGCRVAGRRVAGRRVAGRRVAGRRVAGHRVVKDRI